MTRQKKALILGVTGQDGALLASHLLECGWEVWGGFRRGAQTKLWRLEELEILERVHLVDISINDIGNLISVFRDFSPDQIYHFAGASFVADSFDNPSFFLPSHRPGPRVWSTHRRIPRRRSNGLARPR